ncbi:hypothetical protein A5481_05590 [Methylobacterium platani]|uniref:Glycosyltransferase family 92 protein n=1 Tax=Methylobacterium platani TaxID=427683 RepID=A0A179SGI4_9HYPH|nr:hypothetical protein A5481_05590 [Methylobacterium platani]
MEAYDDCIKNFTVDFDWIAFVDSDEFINPIADRCVKKFLAFHENSNAIVLNRALFGSSGHDRIPAGLIIEDFTHRAVDRHGVNFHTKMIVRPRKVVRVHNPHMIDVEGPTAHADGTPFREVPIGLSADISGFNICRVNHYFVRSAEHWEAKMRRGYREGIRPAEHFASHDTNDIEDESAARWAPEVRQVLAAVDDFPLRERSEVHGGASSEEEKRSDGWASIASTVDDVLYRAPREALRDGNTLFDPEWYRATYADVAASTTVHDTATAARP